MGTIVKPAMANGTDRTDGWGSLGAVLCCATERLKQQGLGDLRPEAQAAQARGLRHEASARVVPLRLAWTAANAPSQLVKYLFLVQRSVGRLPSIRPQQTVQICVAIPGSITDICEDWAQWPSFWTG
eukprot:4719636-Pleurochrysis_carterae.AAC.1